jgi:hypothetical protein
VIDEICARVEPSWPTLSRNGRENVRITVRAVIKEHGRLNEIPGGEPTISVSFPARLLPAIRSAFREHGRFARNRGNRRAWRIEPGRVNIDLFHADAMDEALLVVARAISVVDNE